jgi:hypothetical protein
LKALQRVSNMEKTIVVDGSEKEELLEVTQELRSILSELIKIIR